MEQLFCYDPLVSSHWSRKAKAAPAFPREAPLRSACNDSVPFLLWWPLREVAQASSANRESHLSVPSCAAPGSSDTTRSGPWDRSSELPGTARPLPSIAPPACIASPARRVRRRAAPPWAAETFLH